MASLPDIDPYRIDPYRIPAMDIGGSHVSAAVADLRAGRLVPGSRVRRVVDPMASAADILGAWIATARRVTPASSTWGVAMPGPFDYQRGIGNFAGVGKFAALAGCDVGAALSAGIGPDVRIRFSNDADAFAVGEWLACAEPRPSRLVGITLGTGVGTGFVDAGKVVTDGDTVPPEGSAYRLQIDGRPLEDTASSRAVLAAFNRGRARQVSSVSELTQLAYAGHREALEVFQHAWRAAAFALAPYIRAFGTDMIVVGGSIAGAWDLVRPALLDGLGDWAAELPAAISLRRSRDPESAALLGAAYTASTLL